MLLSCWDWDRSGLRISSGRWTEARGQSRPPTNRSRWRSSCSPRQSSGLCLRSRRSSFLFLAPAHGNLRRATHYLSDLQAAPGCQTRPPDLLRFKPHLRPKSPLPLCHIPEYWLISPQRLSWFFLFFLKLGTGLNLIWTKCINTWLNIYTRTSQILNMKLIY